VGKESAGQRRKEKRTAEQSALRKAGSAKAKRIPRCGQTLGSHPPTSGGDGERVRRATMWQRAAGARREEDGRRAGRAHKVGAQPRLQGGHPEHHARDVGERARAAPQEGPNRRRFAGGRCSADHLINERRNGQTRSHNVMQRFVVSKKLVVSPCNFRGRRGRAQGVWKGGHLGT